MFTGIIEETGMIQKIQKGAKCAELTIQGNIIFDDLKIGDSVSVNGVCLTASGLSSDSFTADVMHETLNRSSLGALRVGDRVNLERAMPAFGRFGGHIVSGHIDGTGVISKIKNDGNAVWYTISAAKKILRYVIEKGSIAIDGISLTVAEVSGESFGVSVIPHTAKNTILSDKTVGNVVNLENDVIGKYVEKLMQYEEKQKSQSSITKEFLIKLGY